MSGSLLRRGARRVARAAGVLDPETRANPMVATHNTTPEALAAMDRNGGVAVAPSIGISRAEAPMSGFGDVTLIAPPEMIDPRRTPVYARDIYSPRYPAIEYSLDSENRARAARAAQGLWDSTVFGGLPADSASYMRDYRQNLVDAFQRSLPLNDLTYNPAVRELWLRQQGVDLDPLLRGRTRQEAAQIITDTYGYHPQANDIYGFVAQLPEQHGIVARERIRVPLDAEGNDALRPHTPQNALRAMQNEARFSHPMAGRDWRGGEQFVTDNWLLAHLAPQFRNVEELRGARGLLVDRNHPAHARWTSEHDSLLTQAAEQVRNAGEPRPDSGVFLRNMADAAREAGFHRVPVGTQMTANSPEWRRLNDALERMSDTYYGGALDRYMRTDLALNLDAGRQLPTTYFEAKPHRNVPLSEFRGAVVPDNMVDRVAPLLERHGIEDIYAYSGPRSPDNPARRDAVSQFERQFFSPVPLALTTGGVAAAARGLLPQDEEPLL